MRRMKGSFTVEAAVIIPLVLFVCGVLLYVLFYYHDKNILTAVAHETLTYACGRDGMDEHELEAHFQKRISGKTMLFTRVFGEVTVEGNHVTVCCVANEKPFVLKVECVTNKTAPEVYIRSVRKIKKLGKEMEEEP